MMKSPITTIIGLLAISMIKKRNSGSFSTLGRSVFDLIHANHLRGRNHTRIFFKNSGSDKPLRDTSEFANPRWRLNLSGMNCPNVTKISFLRVSHIPPVGLGNLKKTRKLLIRECPISKIPDDIYELENLEELTISDTNIMQISEKISKLKNLKVLKISNNKNLQYLPESIVELEDLEELRINGCDIRRLPTNIYKLPKLKTFIIAPSATTSVFGPDRPYINEERRQAQMNRQRRGVVGLWDNYDWGKYLDNHSLRATPRQRILWSNFLERNKKDKRIKQVFGKLPKIKLVESPPENEIRRF